MFISTSITIAAVVNIRVVIISTNNITIVFVTNQPMKKTLVALETWTTLFHLHQPQGGKQLPNFHPVKC